MMKKLTPINTKQLAIGMTIFDPIGLETTITIVDFFTFSVDKMVIAATVNVIGFEGEKMFFSFDVKSSFKLAEPFHLPIIPTYRANENTLFDWMNRVDDWFKTRTLFVLKKQNFSERIVEGNHPPIYFYSSMSEAFVKDIVVYLRTKLRTKFGSLENEHIINFLTLLGAEISNSKHHSNAHEIYIWEQKNKRLSSWDEQQIRDIYAGEKYMLYDVIFEKVVKRERRKAQ